MHILIGVLTALAGLIWGLYRLQNAGLDLNAFNPFLWHRRRQWEKKAGVPAIYTLERPVDVAGLLLLGIARETGEISLEEKNRIRDLMVSVLKRTPNEARDLFAASSYLLRDYPSINGKVAGIIERSAKSFDPDQVESMRNLMLQVAGIDGGPSDAQLEIIAQFDQALRSTGESGAWE